jgi:hypothetical protein
MSPEEICRRLGEPKVKEMFLDLTTDGMKKVLREAKISLTRLASHTSTRRRNEDWAAKLWRAVADRPLTGASATLLFEWLTRMRRPMLAEFLTAIDVQHEGGLTDADFMTASPPEKLQEAGKKLLEHFDKREVAAYLLFLDASNKSEVFAPMALDQHLGPPPPATAQAT